MLPAAAFLLATLAATAPVEPRGKGRSTLRFEVNMARTGLLFDTTKNASFLGLTLSRDLRSWLAIEVTAGFVLPISSTNMTDGTSGAFALGPRLAPLVSASLRHALTFAVEPLFIAGGFNGMVLLAHEEVAYEYRFPSGPMVLVGFGVDEALLGPTPREVCVPSGLLSKCDGTFSPGDVIPHFRFALGAVLP